MPFTIREGKREKRNPSLLSKKEGMNRGRQCSRPHHGSLVQRGLSAPVAPGHGFLVQRGLSAPVAPGHGSLVQRELSAKLTEGLYCFL